MPPKRKAKNTGKKTAPKKAKIVPPSQAEIDEACGFAYDQSLPDAEDKVKEFADSYPNHVDALNSRGQSMLYCCAAQGHVDLMCWLAAHASANIDILCTARNSTPLHAASFYNHDQCVKELLLRGADKTITNSDGSTALDEASKASVKALFKTVKPVAAATPAPAPAAAAAASAPSVPMSTAESEEEESEEEEEEEAAAASVVVKGKAAVDIHCPSSGDYHVLEEPGCVWNFTGNQTNIGANNNKFYILQLLQHDKVASKYVVWTRWGRVGGIDSAKAQFCSKFKAKTANNWDNRDNFQLVPKKYDMLHIDYAADAAEEEKKIKDKLQKAKAAKPKPAKPAAKQQSKLAAPVKSLMQLIFDVKQMTASVVEMKYDIKKLPLGKLTAAQIAAGYQALKECETLMNANTMGKPLEAASNLFYTRIPHAFGMKRPPIINSPQLLKEKVQLLEVLEDIKTALKIIKDAEDEETQVPQEDVNYNSLNCGLDVIDRGTETFDMVETYLSNTHGHTHSQYTLQLVDLFEVDKPSHQYDGSCGNKMLLWHGSRLTNWVGILSQGLRIAPPEAPCTGYMFGKGVYFADMCSKSANYCFTNRKSNTGLLMLCEVACGKQNKRTQADSMLHLHQPKGTHSTWGQGRTAPNPKDTIVVDGDVKVPLGKGADCKLQVKGYGLMYNEFIVYDTSQIKFRYLLRVKFNYK